MKKKKLTMQKAKELAVKVAGTAKGILKDSESAYDIYEIDAGMLHMTIRYPDWQGEDRIGVTVKAPYSCQRIELLFDLDTLVEDDEAEDRQLQRDKRERFAEWIGVNGPEICKQKIDRAWERRE